MRHAIKAAKAALMNDRFRLQMEALDEAERKGWDSLARYKFLMFGYWAAQWVSINRLGGFSRPNPFGAVVIVARGKSCRRSGA